MKNIINKLVFGSLTVALSSCIGNYENINSNPYEAPDLSADGYALGSAMNNLAGCVVSPDVNTAQFTDCLLGGPLGGYFADSNAGFTETISNLSSPKGRMMGPAWKIALFLTSTGNGLCSSTRRR